MTEEKRKLPRGHMSFEHSLDKLEMKREGVWGEKHPVTEHYFTNLRLPECIREDIDAFFNRSKVISSVEESFEEARAFYAKYPQERIIQSVFLQRFENLPPERRNSRRELAREVAGKILSDPWASPSDRGTAIMSMARTTAGEERQRWLALLTDSTANRKTLTEYSIVMWERGPEAAFPYLGVDRILGFRRALLSDLGNGVNPPEETLDNMRTRRSFRSIPSGTARSRRAGSAARADCIQISPLRSSGWIGKRKGMTPSGLRWTASPGLRQIPRTHGSTSARPVSSAA